MIGLSASVSRNRVYKLLRNCLVRIRETGGIVAARFSCVCDWIRWKVSKQKLNRLDRQIKIFGFMFRFSFIHIGDHVDAQLIGQLVTHLVVQLVVQVR